MIGDSPAMGQVRELIARVAPTDSRVLITGESGTGKELVAAAIHAGERAARPAVRARELRGDSARSRRERDVRPRARGRSPARRIDASDASSSRTAARCSSTKSATSAPEAQAKLLRAIEAKEIERVGGGKPIRVDVRIVSATNKDLARVRARGDVPRRSVLSPERHSDSAAAAARAAQRHSGARAALLCPAPHAHGASRSRRGATDAMALLTRHRWPGNVRELANIVERLAILHAGLPVEAEDVAAVLSIDGDGRRGAPPATPLPDPAALDASLSDTLDEYEKMLITRALSMASGNVAEAARRLKTDRPNLYRRMRRLGISMGGERKSDVGATRVRYGCDLPRTAVERTQN